MARPTPTGTWSDAPTAARRNASSAPVPNCPLARKSRSPGTTLATWAVTGRGRRSWSLATAGQ
eukprot:3384550-Lingulodinium_polyedra.AAC.1